jgi:hypothetical protein
LRPGVGADIIRNLQRQSVKLNDSYKGGADNRASRDFRNDTDKKTALESGAQVCAPTTRDKGRRNKEQKDNEQRARFHAPLQQGTKDKGNKEFP